MSIEDRVAAIVRQVVPDIPEDPAINLFDEGHLDSLTVMEILELVEDDFALELPADLVTAENLASVDAISRSLRLAGVES